MRSVSFGQHCVSVLVFAAGASGGCSLEDKPSGAVPVLIAGSSAGPSSGIPAAGSGSAAGALATGAAGGNAGAGSGNAGSSGAAGARAAGSGAAGSGTAGSGTAGSGTAGSGTAGAGAAGQPAVATEHFSFFVTSYAAMQRLSKTPNGFGGDLRYGTADGLAGADKICTEIAEHSMPGAGAKGWRAFLSVTKGPSGEPVHAIDRLGNGPWYDRLGRVLAMNKTDLLQPRPKGADPAIINDFPNEDGVPNHAPDGMLVDNHDMLTGTNNMGQLFNADWRYTCHDWTSSTGSDGTPRVGHSWPRMGGGFPGGSSIPGGGTPPGGVAFPGGTGGIDTVNWMSSLNEAGCAAGASLVEMGPPNPANPTVGSGGGYGGIYCFASVP